MNRNSVVVDEQAARPAPLRLVTGSKESEALVELFLRGDREARPEGRVAAARPASGAPARAGSPAVDRAARVAATPLVADAAGETDALDMLIDGLDAGAGTPDERPAPARVSDSKARAGLALLDRPAVLADRLEGLRRIDARCPYAPGVELATDDAGALHLIAWRGTAEMGGAAIAELQIASKWAWEHIGLLAKIAPLDARCRPAVQHLITAERAGLRHLLTTSLRVHLAVAIEDDHGGRWMCAALNEG